MMKAIKLILIIIIFLSSVEVCCGQNNGEVVARNGIYAMIDIYPNDNWHISMNMFFSEGDTIRISMNNIDDTIRSVLKEGEYVAVGLSNTRNAIADIFDCTPLQALDAESKLNMDLDMTKFERKLIKGPSYGVGISYTQMQAFFFKTTKKKFDGDPTTSEGIPREEVPDEYLILTSIVNMDKEDVLNIEVVD